MSANTLTRQLDQVYENLSAERAVGLRVSTLNATTATGTTFTPTTLTASGAITGAELHISGRGTVTQATDITTGVTVNARCGTITTVSSTLAAGARAQFSVLNSTTASTDIVVCSASTAGSGTPVATATIGDGGGGFTIVLVNQHASAALDAVVTIHFTTIGQTT